MYIIACKIKDKNRQWLNNWPVNDPFDAKKYDSYSDAYEAIGNVLSSFANVTFSLYSIEFEGFEIIGHRFNTLVEAKAIQKVCGGKISKCRIIRFITDVIKDPHIYNQLKEEIKSDEL